MQSAASAIPSTHRHRFSPPPHLPKSTNSVIYVHDLSLLCTIMRPFRGRHRPREVLRQAPPPTVPRMARNYQEVIRGPINRSMYPAVEVDSVAPSIHDVPHVQGLFANDANFGSSTSCEVFEIGTDDSENPIGSWKTITGDTGMEQYVQVSDLLARLLEMLQRTARPWARETKVDPIDLLRSRPVNQV